MRKGTKIAIGVGAAGAAVVAAVAVGMAKAKPSPPPGSVDVPTDLGITVSSAKLPPSAVAFANGFVVAPMPCTSDSECGSGYTCVNGYCTPTSTGTTPTGTPYGFTFKGTLTPGTSISGGISGLPIVLTLDGNYLTTVSTTSTGSFSGSFAVVSTYPGQVHNLVASFGGLKDGIYYLEPASTQVSVIT